MSKGAIMDNGAANQLQESAIEFIAAYFGVEGVEACPNDGEISGITYLEDDSHRSLASVAIPIEELREEIKKAENRVEKTTGMEVFSHKEYYECAVCLEADTWRRLSARNEMPVQFDGAGVSYSLGLCSMEYCLFCILKHLKEKAECKMGRPSGRLRFKVMRARRAVLGKDFENAISGKSGAVDWKEALPRLVGIYSIAITTDRRTTKTRMQEYANSFEFKYMYCNNVSIRRVTNTDDFLYSRSLRNSPTREREFDFPPRKVYDKEAVNYYRLALSSGEPYVQFISFYHVLEHFFSQAFKKGTTSKLRRELTSISFALDEDSLYKIVKSIEKEISGKKEAGYGIEKNELMYLLEEYIDAGALSEELAEGGTDWKEYYSVSKVAFEPNAPTIDWNSPDALGQIANRVYKVRNAIIHSKQRSDGGYKPFLHEEILAGEIPLIRCLAERIIDGAGMEFEEW